MNAETNSAILSCWFLGRSDVSSKSLFIFTLVVESKQKGILYMAMAEIHIGVVMGKIDGELEHPSIILAQDSR